MSFHVLDQWADEEDARLEDFLRGLSHCLVAFVALMAVLTTVVQVRKAMGR